MSNETDLSNNNIKIEETSFFSRIIQKFNYYHIEKDNDGLYNGLIMPKSHANYLYYTSHMSLFSGLYGLYKNDILALYPLSVYFTSINYWRHPLNDWRRYFDIMCAGICIIGQTINAYGRPNFNVCLSIMVSGVLCYPFSFYFQDKYLPLSTLFHSLIHIVCNIANYILYSYNEEICII